MSNTDRQRVTARNGIFPLVVGQNVSVQNAASAVLIAKQHLAVTRGGGQWLIAGRDQKIEHGGGAVLLSRAARVTNGFVGVLVASRVTLDGGARALVTIPARVVAATAAAFVVGIVVGRRRRAAA